MIVHAAALLPIAPILLLPFILIFFIIVFPFWLIGVAVLWTVYQIVRLVGGGANRRAAVAVHRWFRWVLTFGGFAENYTGKSVAAPPDASGTKT